MQTQAPPLAYIDAFWVLMLISLAAVPLALVLRKVKLGAPPRWAIEADPTCNRSGAHELTRLGVPFASAEPAALTDGQPGTPIVLAIERPALLLPVQPAEPALTMM